MVQQPLFQTVDSPALPPGTNELLVQFRAFRESAGASKSTVAAETSQLRSLAREAAECSGESSLDGLRQKPTDAALLMEGRVSPLTLPTAQTRIRAFQRLLMMGVPDSIGRERVAAFRAALPRKDSKGWHDAGISLPGLRTRSKMPGPTPAPEDIERIIAIAAKRSPTSGAVAALACFSGLDVQTIVNLRWKDLTWQDHGQAPYWEVLCERRGRRVCCYIVGPGVGTLLRWGLATGLEREAYVFHGRESGSGLSIRAFRDRLRQVCTAAGWPRATRSQLISALAAWLRQRDMDDHSIRLVLARRRVASVDRMLHKHEQLAAQEQIDRALLESQGTSTISQSKLRI